MALSVWALLSGCEGGYGCGTSNNICGTEEVNICTCGSRPILEREVASLPRSPEAIRSLIPPKVQTMIDYCDPHRGQVHAGVSFTFDPIQIEHIGLLACDNGPSTVYVIKNGVRLAVESEGASWAAYFPTAALLVSIYPPESPNIQTELRISGKLALSQMASQPDAEPLRALLESARQKEGWEVSDDQVFVFFGVTFDLSRSVESVSPYPFYLEPGRVGIDVPLGCEDTDWPRPPGWFATDINVNCETQP